MQYQILWKEVAPGAFLPAFWAVKKLALFFDIIHICITLALPWIPRCTATTWHVGRSAPSEQWSRPAPTFSAYHAPTIWVSLRQKTANVCALHAERVWITSTMPLSRVSILARTTKPVSSAASAQLSSWSVPAADYRSGATR